MTHRDRSEYKTRSSVKAVCKSVTITGMTGHVRRNTQLKRNMPKDTRIATLYQRLGASQTSIKPDFCLHTTEDWLVFPYEMNGLSRESHRVLWRPFRLSQAAMA